MSIYKNIYYIQLKPIYYKKKFFLINNNKKIRDMLSYIVSNNLDTYMIKIVQGIIRKLHNMLPYYIFLYETLYLKIYTKCYHSIYFYLLSKFSHEDKNQ